MSDAIKDLPPCMWCGNDATKEHTTSTAPSRERWFECGYCNRIFCVVFMPDEPGKTDEA